MSKTKTALVLIALVSMSGPAVAHSSVYCYQSGTGVKGGGSLEVNSFRIIVQQEPDEGACLAMILSDSGDELFRIQDSSVDVLPVTGKDINRDGHPDAVLESFSGGAHCCWTYSIVSLSEKGGLIQQFENRTPASFEDLHHDGSLELVTQDGAFDEFDGLAHPFSPFPTLVLRLNRNKFEDIGAEFWPVYERRIEQVRKDIRPGEFDHFTRSNPVEVHDDLNYLKTESGVLTIALQLLYGGRQRQAWKTLDEMWPPSDRDRIKQAIIDKYCTGLRADLGLPPASECRFTKDQQQPPPHSKTR